jgi:hypothetical protein
MAAGYRPPAAHGEAIPESTTGADQDQLGAGLRITAARHHTD